MLCEDRIRFYRENGVAVVGDAIAAARGRIARTAR